MDFNLTEEQNAFADSVRKFAQKELADGALERAHSHEYPWEIAAKLSEMGLLGITLKEEDGGMGGTLMDAVIAIQELALVCPKSADVVQAGNFGAIRTFAEYASPYLKEKFLPNLLAGKTLLALGMSEPGAGSSVTELKTSAVEDGDHYVINGSKVFSTHSPHADTFLIYVRFGAGLDGIGSVIVERGTPGFDIGQPSAFMSGEEWCQLYFENCRIPKENVLLGPGGFKKQISGFNVERIGNASRALALGRHAFNVARQHCLDREQFGKALCEFQGLQWKFAEMALKLESAQLLLYRAAVNADGGLPSAYETSVAKLSCNLSGWEVSNEALQAMGGYGYSTESLVEYCVKRTRGWMIAGGSIEVLKNRIAEDVFGRRFNQRAK
ncbi:acyl-CoA dehydrogenase family protein [Acinetobacter pragensis]|uniref:Acyl-CoA dehydrogenase n=5 Tax=Acinetobacter pragensis TaxID=1806892 RepID=A0A151Y602_9GAMM|nr:acyl-CoA dehydrogenase family protein [Acinetobacter pragensis]KYQ73420.1 acyl-CoA dehydrogenase [Acinetobacter pragensis]